MKARRASVRGALGMACVAAGLLAAGTTAAESKVYKSLDARGNVIYSAKPVPGAVRSDEMRLEDAPSDTERAEAEARAGEMDREATRLTNEIGQKQARRSAATESAQSRLKQARAQLEQARIQSDDDWQGLAQGGRHLKPAYFERVQRAEEAVQQAEKALAKAQRDQN